MAQFDLKKDNLPHLKGKVVVLTGGANGIGAATVKLMSQGGAYVVFGDIDATGGDAVEAAFSRDVHFLHTDVTSYKSILALFDKALDLYGQVDIAVSNAGIIEQPGWFEPKVDLESVRTAPSTVVLDVNLLGSLYFSRIAAVYLRQKATAKDDKSIVLISSVAGFQESPGLFVYQSAKHGVLGLMRSLRKYFPSAYSDVSIRINCVCPWATDTVMVKSFQQAWKNEGLPINTSEGVARMIVGILVDQTLNGESIYVEGDRGWQFEEGLERTQAQWLGESANESLTKGQKFLGSGSKW